MNNERILLNSNEQLARNIVGLETEAKHFVVNGQEADELLKAEAQDKFNTKVEEFINKFDSHAEKLEEYKQYVKENLNNLEICPLFNYVLVKPFDENPFQQITKSSGGIITDLGGQKPIFKNQDNGQIEEEENFIKVATVIEAGAECKYLRNGDVVMYTKTSALPVPFYKQGLEWINENRAMVVINENLIERFKNERR